MYCLTPQSLCLFIFVVNLQWNLSLQPSSLDAYLALAPKQARPSSPQEKTERGFGFLSLCFKNIFEGLVHLSKYYLLNAYYVHLSQRPHVKADMSRLLQTDVEKEQYV